MLRVFNSTARYVNQCFTPDTMIVTKNGSKPIESINVGEEVVTIDGTYKPVLQVINNQVNKTILSIKVNGFEYPVRVTKEHEIYRNTGKEKLNGEFVSAGELKVGDVMAYPLGDNKYNYNEIESISELSYGGYVYDLNIQDNHNYVVSNLGIVHNSGKRNGSMAIYLEPWHADVEKFLDMRKNHGNEEERARDLFYALWIPDLFMKRVKEDGMWSLMCPDECKHLSEIYGDEFEDMYTRYEKEGKFRKQMRTGVVVEDSGVTD